LSVPAYFFMKENRDAIVVLTGTASTLYDAALAVGLVSLVLAAIVRSRIRRMTSSVKRSDVRRIAITIAGIAACIWILPFCTMAGSGL
jgi:phosphoglycerol transferase MdoB-like AlkP superfamily enzyme